MALGETSTSSIENAQRMTDAESVNRASESHRSVREAWSSCALYHPFADRSLPQIDQSHHGRRRRRWKLINCFRRTSSSIPSSRDAPPTYSSTHIGLISPSDRRSSVNPINDRSPVTVRIPPPSYTQAQEVNDAASTAAPIVTLSPRTRFSWPREPTIAVCPQCSSLIMTTVTARQSMYTHLMALVLCLVGCWPCCLIPYCIDCFYNRDHFCPICDAHLGSHVME